MHNGSRQKPAFTQYAAIRSYQPSLAYSPDGCEIAYSTNTSGQFNLWRQPVAGGYPRQVTTYDNESVRTIAWSPTSDQILYTADRDGDEFYTPTVISAQGGIPRKLTSEPEVQYFLGDRAFSPDGRLIAYAGNDREPTEQDVIVQDLETGTERRVMAGANFQPGAFSPDGKYLSVVEFRSNTDLDTHIVNLETGDHEKLDLGDGKQLRAPGPWFPDGSGLWIVSDVGREFNGIGKYDLALKTFSWDITPDWGIEQFDISGDGSLLVWIVNEDGRSVVHARNVAIEQEIELPQVPLGVIGALSIAHDGSSIAVLLNRPTHPFEIFIIDLKAGQTRQITDGMLGGISPEFFVEPELVHYPTFDGRMIPAWLYRPKGQGPFGAVLSIHGGPESQERPTYAYNGLYQYLVSRGIAVLAPNVRGSTGYGITYQKLIYRDWGGDELRDFEASAKYLQSLSWIDPSRLAVYGGSFGGFATLSCVSRLPDYWAAAVDIVGPSNLVTFAKAVPPTWRSIMAEWVGDPYTEEAFMLSRSPITYVDQIKAPIFIIQGANDPRVVKPESDQIVERLRERGVDVRYDVYEDEGHGFTKRSNSIKAMGDIADFLEKHLNGKI